MKKSFLYICFLLLSFTLILSCHEDSIEETIITDDFEPFTIYEVDVSGLVSDQEGAPIANAIVSMDDQTVRTNQYGYFKLEDISSGAQGAWLEITAAGFIPTGRRIDVLNSLDMIVDINMLLVPEPDIINGEAGETINITSRASVRFAPNGIQRDGQLYSGTVYVRSLSISPDDPDLTDKMPGSLVGVNLDNDLQSLRSYGMFYVTLEDDQGRELQPDTNAGALLQMQIPDKLISDAPSSMPMWYFDQSIGYWIEEGVATKVGDVYQARVSHFTWWNIDLPIGDLINTCITVSLEDQLLTNTELLFSIAGQPFGLQTTNDEGVICVALPKDLTITLSLYNELCEVSPGTSIGPFSSDQMNVEVIVEENSENKVALTGTVTDCDGQQISNSQVYIIRAGTSNVLETDQSGQYNILILCTTSGEQIEILAVDAIKQKSKSTVISITNAETVSQDITVCDEIENLLVADLNGNAFTGAITDIQVNPNETIISTTDQCYLSFLGNTTGTFEGTLQCSNADIYDNLQVRVTEFDSIIKGTFTGSNITGSFSTTKN